MLTDVTDFCRMFLFRHPELSPADSGRAVGAGPAELGRRGQQTVLRWLRLVERVELAAVFAPDQPQCADPAAALAATKGLEVTTDKRLRDQQLGRWESRSWDDIARDEPDRVREFFEDFGEVAAPEGESLGQAVERLLGWWTEVRDATLGKTAALVMSGAMVSGFSAAMLGMRISRAVSLNLPHGGLGILDLYANGVRVSCWNPTALSQE